jgi:hypothetical protein
MLRRSKGLAGFNSPSSNIEEVVLWALKSNGLSKCLSFFEFLPENATSLQFGHLCVPETSSV